MRAQYALLVLFLTVQAPAQMVSAGAGAHPGKPLPPGLKAPRLDFRDVAREAGITAENVSGVEKQKSLTSKSPGWGGFFAQGQIQRWKSPEDLPFGWPKQPIVWLRALFRNRVDWGMSIMR
jgi:hypothetical protein